MSAWKHEPKARYNVLVFVTSTLHTCILQGSRFQADVEDNVIGSKYACSSMSAWKYIIHV